MIFVAQNEVKLTNHCRKEMEYSLDPKTNLDATIDVDLTSKIFLLIFYLHLLVICVVGNGMILSGCFGRGVLKTDRVTVMCVEGLALLDCAIALFHGFPVVVTLLSGGWVLGPVMCLLNAFVSRALYINEIFLTVSISCYRLWMLKQPRAVRDRINLCNARGFLLLLSAVSLGLAGSQLHFGGVRFEPLFLSCTFTQISGGNSPELTALGSVILLAIPMIIIIVTNLLIVTTAAKNSRAVRIRSALPIPMIAGSELRRSSSALFAQTTTTLPKLEKRSSRSEQSTFITISMVCWLFVCSYLPTIVLTIFIATKYTPPNWYYPFTVAFLTINIEANPFVYGATNKSFREYVLMTGRTRCSVALKRMVGMTWRRKGSGFVPLEGTLSGSGCQTEYRSRASDD